MVGKVIPVHPGEVLREEILAPIGLSASALARELGVPRTRMCRLVSEEVAMTADTALRLARYFGMSASFWMNIQARYDLESAETKLAPALRKITPRPADACHGACVA